MTTNLTAKNFEQFFQENDKMKVIAYGWGTCKPCQAQKPYFEQLATLYPSFSFGESDRNNSSVLNDWFPELKRAPSYLIVNNDKEIVAEYYFIDELADNIASHLGEKENNQQYVRAENREERMVAKLNELVEEGSIDKQTLEAVLNA